MRAEEKSLGAKRKEAWDLEKSIKERQRSLYTLRSQLSQLETDKDKESGR